METVTEEKKPEGLKAYQLKQQQQKEQAKGIALETKALTQEPAGEDEKPLKPVVDRNKTYVFEAVVKSKNPRNELIGSTCTIFDPVQQRTRQIRYIPIADTIYVDEMGERYKDYALPTISMYNNKIEVPGTDARLVEYLMAHDAYDGNENRLSRRPAEFTLVNKEDIELKKEQLYNYKLKALNAINAADIKELLPLARVVFNVLATDTLSVKNELRKYAETKPATILNNIDNPRVVRGYLIQGALDHGILEINQENKSLMWKETNIYITDLSATTDPSAQLTEITDFTFTPVGTKMYDILKQKVKI